MARRRSIPDGFASPADVRKVATTWEPQVVECRLNRHFWVAFGVRHYTLGRYYLIVQRCGRDCGVRRIAEMDEDGYLITRWRSVYPSEGYLAKGIGRVGPDGLAALRIDNISTGVDIEEVKE